MKIKRILAMVAILSAICCFTACNTASTNVTREERDADSTVSEVVSSEDETSSEDSEEAESEADSEEESDVSEEESESEDESKAESETESKDEESSESSQSESEDGAFVYAGVSIVLPENFTVDDSTSALAIAYPDTYPEETDNINFTKTNESAAVYTEDNINKTMKTLFEDYQGCRNYKKYTIDGCDAVSYDHTITVSGIEVEQKQLAVFADSTVIMTFTSITGNYDDAFQKAIDSVKVVD